LVTASHLHSVIPGQAPAYAQGGPVAALSGPNPPGPDQGFAALHRGEFVVQAPEAARYSSILQQINDGTFPMSGQQSGGSNGGPYDNGYPMSSTPTIGMGLGFPQDPDQDGDDDSDPQGDSDQDSPAFQSTFNDPNDRVALGILGELFRDRPVVGIHAVDLVWGFGSLHCLTQQQPA
jgi:hypothetical protein